MRRKEREITDPAILADILFRAPVCHVAMIDGTTPYIVPLNFGHAGQALYIHCAPEGRKIGILRANPRVCFEVSIDSGLIKRGEKACDYGYKYRSVIGWGTAAFIESLPEKRTALDLIMNHYEKGEYTFPERSVEKITIIRIDIAQMTGKQAGWGEG